MLKTLALLAAVASTAASMPVTDASAATPPAVPTQDSPYISATINADGSVRIVGTLTTIDFASFSAGFPGNTTKLREAVDAYLATKKPFPAAGVVPNAVPNCGGYLTRWEDGPYEQEYTDYPCLRCSGAEGIEYSQQTCWGVSISLGGELAKYAFSGSVDFSYQSCTGWSESCSRPDWARFICMRETHAKKKRWGRARFYMDCGGGKPPLGEEPQGDAGELVSPEGYTISENVEIHETIHHKTHRWCDGRNDQLCRSP
ncbi:hypothetical protein HDU96_008598 [Phlyctochytrium bullatum]|nr:hypothetical protein HDU96_008598 [Phlyctochytrium bullatum]